MDPILEIGLGQMFICNCPRCDAASANDLFRDESTRFTRRIDQTADDDRDYIRLEDFLASPMFLREQRELLTSFERSNGDVANISVRPRNSSSTTDEPRASMSTTPTEAKVSCPICLDDLLTVGNTVGKMVTKCGHLFCQQCIENVRAVALDEGTSAMCPVCRKDIGTLRNVHL